MAHKSRPTFQKAQREKAKQEKRQAKLARRIGARQEKNENDSSEHGEDPDIAGIRPGPQPLPWWHE